MHARRDAGSLLARRRFDQQDSKHLALFEERAPLRMVLDCIKHIIRNLPDSKLRMIVVWIIQDHYS